jgi:ABC-type polysaccharide/polyol phosphate transport system ATPase subunit
MCTITATIPITAFIIVGVVLLSSIDLSHALKSLQTIQSTSFTLRMAVIETTPATQEKGTSTVLSCRGLSKTYAEIPQFSDIALNLGRGQRVGLIGVNGAGKST